MTFSNSDLVLLADGNDKKLFYHDANNSSDTLATVKAAGYYNNTDDEIRMAVGDIIFAYASDGYAFLRVSAVSSGSVTTKAVDNLEDVANVAAGANLDSVGISLIGNDTDSSTSFTLDDPIVGETKTIIQVDTTTTGVEIVTNSTSVSFNVAGNRTLTFNGADDAVVLKGLSSTRWGVVSNVGSVAAS